MIHGPSVFAAEDIETIEVAYTTGTVDVLIAPSTDWLQAQVGDELRSGDHLRTGGSAKAELSFGQGQLVNIEELSHVVILLKGNNKLELVDGEVFATVSNLLPGSSFEIKTSVGTAGVRGTDWTTKFSDGEMSVEAYDGTPFVKSLGIDGTLSSTETPVMPGYGTRFRRFERPAVPFRIPEARVNAMRARKAEMIPRILDYNKMKPQNRPDDSVSRRSGSATSEAPVSRRDLRDVNNSGRSPVGTGGKGAERAPVAKGLTPTGVRPKPGDIRPGILRKAKPQNAQGKQGAAGGNVRKPRPPAPRLGGASSQGNRKQ